MRTALYAGSKAATSYDGKIFAALAAALRRFDQWRQTRRAIRSLSRLPDEMLKDIGLTRGEIDEAVRTRRPRPETSVK